jgi:multicomponent K+:H+ antiporter subunit D
VFADEYRDPYDAGPPTDEVGVIIPVAIALLSGGFILCALLLAGMPPLSGFIGKLAIMAGLLQGAAPSTSWILIAVLTLSSFTAIIALMRVGIQVLWAPAERPAPRVRGVEFTAVAGLLIACIVITISGAWVLRYTDDTVSWLSRPHDYVAAVLGPAREAPQ